MIGSRGLDMHVAGLARMGAEISGEHGFVIASAPAGLRGCKIWLDFPSVGATENLLMAAGAGQGRHRDRQRAREPEIVDICAMLHRDGRADLRCRHLYAGDRGRSDGQVGPAHHGRGPIVAGPGRSGRR
jgi:UDP-N-acetylglucosamine enolpyruvyl transferase